MYALISMQHADVQVVGATRQIRVCIRHAEWGSCRDLCTISKVTYGQH
jgi:hypothetical protein